MLQEAQKLFNGDSEGFTLVREGHFALSSGLHTSRYVDVKQAMSATPVRKRIAREMALPFSQSGVQIVMGSGSDGALLASAVADMSHFSEDWWNCAWTVKEEGVLFIPDRAKDFVRNRRVLLVDDVLTTGKTLGDLKVLVEAEGGQVVGSAVVCRRGMDIFPDVHSAFVVSGDEYEAVKAEDCELCKQGLPVDEVFGHPELL